MVNSKGNQLVTDENRLKQLVARLRSIQKQINEHGTTICHVTELYLAEINAEESIVTCRDLKQNYMTLIDAIEQYRTSVIWYKSTLTYFNIFSENPTNSLSVEVYEYCKHILLVQVLFDLRRIEGPLNNLQAKKYASPNNNYILSRWCNELKYFSALCWVDE